jgi:hopene-associated glycosyltransferase HpnB
MVSKNLAHAPRLTESEARVAVVIPARNEADIIADTLNSLLSQSYPSPMRIVVVNDGSSDATASVAQNTAAAHNGAHTITVIEGKPLPGGWTGKLWAQAQGVEQALADKPDFLLFTDADIQHSPHTTSELVALAETDNYDLASYMVKLACRSFAEKSLIPAFVFFFLQLYPPAWIRSPRSRTAGAAGGCILIRPEALERIGGLAAIRNAVIDDCTLARAVKRSGGRVWLGLTAGSVSTRSYGSFAEIGRMISRTAFSQLNHSGVILAATVLGLAATYLTPVAAVLSGNVLTLALGLAAWLLMALSYAPMVRFYNRPVWWSVTLPFVASFYMAATIWSAIQYWRGKGGLWKERLQDSPRM